MSEEAARVPTPPRATAAVILMLGLALAIPSGLLLSLGGSPYYLIAGAFLIGSSVLLWRGDGRGLWLYGVLLVVGALWAIWEVGFDGWALLPRVAGPLLLGAWLATPLVRRGLPRHAIAGPLAGVCVAGVAMLLALGILLQGRSGQGGPAPGALSAPAPQASVDDDDWLEYGRDKGGTRFSPLAQITPANASRLRLAWTYRTKSGNDRRFSAETTPLKIRDRLYLCTGANKVIALDAETGREIWTFDPKVDKAKLFGGTCRGAGYFRAPNGAATCPERIITATVDGRLIALDLRNGAPCADFGDGGQVKLTKGMGLVDPGYYFVSSAPQISRGKVIVGGWVTDGQYVGEPSGVIRAFDAVSGKFVWAWDMGRPGYSAQPPPGESFTRGTPNSWAPISADETLGLVFLPTGNATPDYYGGHRRPFDDLYSSAVVALDTETGALRWSFQTTHHDVWDYDVASQPTLVDLPDGVPALLQPTKRGEIFLLDRRTGQPIARVDERPVPQGGAPGDRLADTQPFSVGMPSFAGPMPTERRMWGVTPFDQLWCRIRFRQARFEGTLTPIGLDRPTIVYPGYLGGVDWGGVSVDPHRHMMIVNSSRLGNYDQLLTRKHADELGIKPATPLHGVIGGAAAQAGTPYAAAVEPFLSPLGVPCTQPPFGMISGVDLRTRKVVWTKRFGTAEGSGPFGVASHLPFTMGVPNSGGSVVTGGGVFFIAAAQDNYLRAYETATGREIWRVRLPAGGQATPMTYRSAKSGRQFVVISAGGHGSLRTPMGDYILAFALPTGS